MTGLLHPISGSPGIDPQIFPAGSVEALLHPPTLPANIRYLARVRAVTGNHPEVRPTGLRVAFVQPQLNPGVLGRD
jgi:hypothetical protein